MFPENTSLSHCMHKSPLGFFIPPKAMAGNYLHFVFILGNNLLSVYSLFDDLSLDQCLNHKSS